MPMNRLKIIIPFITAAFFLSFAQNQAFKEAQRLYNNGRYEASIKLLNTVCTNDPRNYQVLKYLMLNHEKLGQYDQAYIYADSAIRCGDHSFEAFVNAGDLAYKLDKREQAFNTLMIAYRMDSTGPMVNYDLGILHWLKFDGVSQGLYYMKRESALYPENAEALSAIGQMYLNIDSIDSSIFYFNKAVNAAPDNFLYYYLRGLAWSSINRSDSAINDLTKCLALNSSFADARYDRALIFIYRGLKKEGCDDLRQLHQTSFAAQADSLSLIYCK